MKIKSLKRKCPVCGCNTGEFIYNQVFAMVKGSPLPSEYDIVCCTECGFVFADTPADQDDYNKYYTILSKYEDTQISSGSGSDKNDLERLIRTADIIEKHAGKEVSVLDIGCANGGQLKVLKSRGFYDLTGVDPSEICVENVRKSGINAYQAHFFEQTFIDWNKKFDLIILSHILEHILDLGKAIMIAAGKLKDKGILYIEVPDASRYADHFIVPYYYIDSEHINHFSMHSLSNLMYRSDFSSLDQYRGEIKMNSTQNYPFFCSLFKRNGSLSADLQHDSSVKESFMKFLAESKNREDQNSVIQHLEQSGEEVIIWGAGQYALRLLGSGQLAKINIVGFIDTDKSKHGKTLGNFHIYSPEYLVNKNTCTLLICSALYADDIVASAEKAVPGINYYVLR